MPLQVRIASYRSVAIYMSCVVNSVFFITGNQARDKFDALEEFEQEREQDRKKLAKKKDAVVGNIPQAGGKFFFSAIRHCL